MKIKKTISNICCFTCVIGFFSSCKKLPRVVEIDERRELCQYDDVTVFKNSYDQILATQPLEWRRVNRTEFRLLNYAVGNDTEVAVGQVEAGGVLANMNRWRGEFGLDGLVDLEGLEQIQMFGGLDAYVIRIKGTFQKKMSGMPVKVEEAAVTGVICDIGDGALITVKMMGPEDEVMAEQDNLMRFSESIRMNTLQEPSERSKQGADINKTKGGY